MAKVTRSGETTPPEPTKRPDRVEKRPASPPPTPSLKGDVLNLGIPVVPEADKKKYKLVIDLVSNELFVVDKKTEEPVDAYLISPGSAEHPTRGDRFVLKKVIPNPTWTPPKSKWAEGMDAQEPGRFNNMGVMKLDMGKYNQYIHGTPFWHLPSLGSAASHGCIRMSNSNVAHLYQNYATVGTVVEINRDQARSQAMHSKYAVSGRVVHSIWDGGQLADAIFAKGD